MRPQFNPRLLASCQTFAKVAGVMVILVGGLGLAAWAFNFAAWPGMRQILLTMKPNTALAFILAGLALWLLSPPSPGPAAGRRAGKTPYRLAQVCALVVALLGLLTLSQDLFGWDLGIDQLLFREPLATLETSSPGRMTPMTALNFLLLGVALLLLDSKLPRVNWLTQCLTLLTMLTSLLGLHGYAYRVAVLYTLTSYTPMPLPTALTFLILSAGLLFTRPNQALMAAVTSDSVGGMIVRRSLPVVVLIPLLLGWLRLAGERAGLYSLEFGDGLLALSNIIIFTVLICLNAAWLFQMDRQRQQAEAELEQYKEHLEEQVAARTADLTIANEQLQQEIAERKQAEAALAEERRLLRTLMDNLPDYVFVKDTESRFVLNNMAHVQVLGATRPEEVLGQTDFDIWPADLAGQYYADDQSVIQTGQPLISREEITIDPQGQKQWLLTTKVPLADNQGKIVGLVGICRDISERKQIEEELKQYHSQLEALVEERTADLTTANEQLQQEIIKSKQAEVALVEERNFTATVLATAGALIMVLDAQGRIIHFNRACEQTTGYTFGEVKGKYFWDIFLTPEEMALVRIIFEELRVGLSPHEYESYWLTKAGQRRLIAWTSTARRDPTGSLEYVIATGIDITERKQLEEQLRQSQKMEAIGQLAGGIAHDFNNLLLVINGYSELLLQRHLPEGNPARRYVEEIEKAGERAAALTRQLLAFSRKQLLQPQVLDLNTVVGDVEKMLRRLIEEPIELSTLLEPELGPVKADLGQLEQVIMNLAVNARDAMPEGGQLIIETANVTLDEHYTHQHAEMEPGLYVMLAVSDTGSGIDKETMSHIFEPFFTTKEQGKGTGLGLATVYGMVKQSGGDIWVYSEMGHGTTFKIYLPRVEETVSRLSKPDLTDDLPQGTETILLAEDEVAVRNLAAQVLRQQGYTVLEAGNGSEALQAAQEQGGTEIHLLLTDIVMPKMGGTELAERLKALRPHIKVVFMSGYTDSAIIRYGLPKRGGVFLPKPFSPGLLAHKIREVLDLE